MDQKTFSIFRDLVTSRRSVRKFAPRPVDPGIVKSVMEAVRFSPSPTNRQCFRFIAVQDPLILQSLKIDVIRKIDEISETLEGESSQAFREYAKWFTFFEQAPLVVFGLFRTFVSRLPGGRKSERRLEGLAEIQAFGGAVHAMLLGLYAMDLGSCWMSGPLVTVTQIEELLHIERPWQVGAVIPVGWPESSPPVPKKPGIDAFFGWFPAC